MMRAAVQEIVTLSRELASAVEAGELELAERLLEDRGRLLQALSGKASGEAAAGMAGLAGEALRTDALVRRGLERNIAAIHESMGGVTTTASAVRAYLPLAPVLPGFVDVRD